MLIHLVIQLGAFAATHIFRAFLKKKKVVVICFLTSSLAPRKIQVSTRNTRELRNRNTIYTVLRL